MNNQKKSNILYSKFSRSIIIPLISIFLLLITSIIVIVFTSFVSQLSKNIEESKLDQLDLIERNISNRFREVTSISYNVGAGKEFLLNPVNEKKYSGYKMSESLKQLLTGNDFISYLAYYRLSEPDKIYTSIGEMSYHNFWTAYIDFEGITENQSKEILLEQDKSVIIPMRQSVKGKSFMTVIKAIPPLAKVPSAYVLSFISADEFHSVTEAILIDCFAKVLIYDEYDNLVYEHGNIVLDTTSIFPELEKLLERDSQTIKIDGEKYLLQKSKSPYNNWKYVSVIRKSDIMSSLTNSQYNFFIFLLITLFVSILATFTCIVLKYSPIYQLAHAVISQTNRNTPTKKMSIDEQSILSNTFFDLMNEKKLMYREIFYSNLLGDQYDEHSIEYAMEEYDIDYENAMFCAIGINLSRLTLSKVQRNELMELIEDYFDTNDVQCDMIYRSKPEHVLVFANWNEEKYTFEQFTQQLLILSEMLEKTYGYIMEIGVGNCCGSALQLSVSVKEATSAMYYSIVGEKNTVLKYDDIEIEKNNDKVTRLVSDLLHDIKRGNSEKISHTMEEMKISFDELGISQIHRNYICFNIISSLYDYVEDIQVSDRLDKIMEELLKKSYIRFNVLEMIESICIEISDQKRSARNNQNDELMNTILQVITDNLCDSMLSLDSISTYCGISSSYLSRYFKANMGCTPMNYIEQQRMNIVKDKLLNTDDSLKQILGEIGYIDQSNFIRKFKRLEGVTPMNYRKIRGDDKNAM